MESIESRLKRSGSYATALIVQGQVPIKEACEIGAKHYDIDWKMVWDLLILEKPVSEICKSS